MFHSAYICFHTLLIDLPLLYSNNIILFEYILYIFPELVLVTICNNTETEWRHYHEIFVISGTGAASDNNFVQILVSVIFVLVVLSQYTRGVTKRHHFVET